jgi:hypothetical protein
VAHHLQIHKTIAKAHKCGTQQEYQNQKASVLQALGHRLKLPAAHADRFLSDGVTGGGKNPVVKSAGLFRPDHCLRVRHLPAARGDRFLTSDGVTGGGR